MGIGFCCLLPMAAQEELKDPGPEIIFSMEGGFYEEPIELTLFSSKNAKIYYTTNGSRPSRYSKVYRGPIQIDSSLVVRAIAYEPGKFGKLYGHSYLINEPISHFPTISIAISSSTLFDPDEGLFMQGARANDSLLSKEGANFWNRNEFSIHCDIFDPEDRMVYNSECGLRLFGGMSRLFPQKSLALISRNEYGEKRFRHRFFGKKGLKSFKFLVLRNSGSDWSKSHFRDAFMTSLVDEWDIEKQDSEPAHVYINGKYWGIYNIREKVNKYFIEDHAGVDRENIDLIEHFMTLKKGSMRHYRNLLKYLEAYQLDDPSHYAHVDGQMEIKNFLQLQIAQIYFDNRDAGGNIKFWRSRTEGGRWRWILFDTDWGFGLHDREGYQFNTLDFHTSTDGPSWPNPPWSTFLLRKLLESKSFEKDFVNTFADHLNTTFSTSRVESRLNDFYEKYRPEISRHLQRWNLNDKRWENEVQIMRTFARSRPHYVWKMLEERFETGPTSWIEVKSNEGGHILINNNVKAGTQAYRGRYFENYPIRIKAVPNYGYRFSHWEGIDIHSSVQEFQLELTDNFYQVRAVFEPYIHPIADKVIINEICPKGGKASDWIELYNQSDETVFLRNWILTDSKNEWQIPNAKISPRDYLVICQDSLNFVHSFPQVYNVVGGMPFGLNKVHEKIGLFANRNAMVDSVSYELEPLDSNFTLDLLLPTLNNGDSENWVINIGPGSPNAGNPYFVHSSIRARQEWWIQVGAAAAVLLICIMMLIFRHKGRL